MDQAEINTILAQIKKLNRRLGTIEKAVVPEAKKKTEWLTLPAATKRYGKKPTAFKTMRRKGKFPECFSMDGGMVMFDCAAYERRLAAVRDKEIAEAQRARRGLDVAA